MAISGGIRPIGDIGIIDIPWGIIGITPIVIIGLSRIIGSGWMGIGWMGIGCMGIGWMDIGWMDIGLHLPLLCMEDDA
jgi:hypothetical protein